jgi:adenine-specific DNA-methyltransferase
MLDPACGDGRFLAAHDRSIGVELDPESSRISRLRSPGSLIHQGDFFAWAGRTSERFECAAGNPPFIRYQSFAGETRQSALALCARHGARFSALTSSWAPFMVATATLLKPGGRMAFVVPAEIGHAPYASPVLEYLLDHFDRIQVIGFQRKIFPELSEDCWLLFADGFGGSADSILLSTMSDFEYMVEPPRSDRRVPRREWKWWNRRLRSFLLPDDVRHLYQQTVENGESAPLGKVAKVGIGYVTGDNDFFHLRPSEAEDAGIPEDLLKPTVRNGRSLRGSAVTPGQVQQWRAQDEPNFLLRLGPGQILSPPLRRYLDSPAGHRARESYKCRNRDPWYAVPQVVTPDAFLAYMCGKGPALVANHAGCTGTNSVHMVIMTGGMKVRDLQNVWSKPLTQLSCEIEGHPLGGGMLKLEPREAGRVVLDLADSRPNRDLETINEGIAVMRQWRHCA